jgi:hypothetical protein
MIEARLPEVFSRLKKLERRLAVADLEEESS